MGKGVNMKDYLGRDEMESERDISREGYKEERGERGGRVGRGLDSERRRD